MSGARLALYTTVYPGVEKYLSDWYRSVAAQTDGDFDLWISVDTLEIPRVVSAMGAEPPVFWLKAPQGATAAQIRHEAIAKLVDQYSSIVFVDSDDLLEPSRVEAARKGLEGHDVVGCALRIMAEDGKDLGVTFAPEPGENLGSLLSRYNVFGLSNTAYRSHVLKRCIPVVRECVLIDWLLATRAWMHGADLWFDFTPRMKYRQYSSNVARVVLPFRPDDILLATGRVLDHYTYVLQTENRCAAPQREAIRASRARVDGFHKAVHRSPAVLKAYVDALNQLSPHYVWWWSVAHPDLEYLWTS